MIGVSVSILGILVVGAIAVATLVGASQVLKTLTGRQSHEVAIGHERRSNAGPVIGIIGLAAVGLVMMFTLVSYQTFDSRGPDEVQEARVAHDKPLPTESSVEVGQTALTNDSDKQTVPEWTRHPETVLAEGLVGCTHFVATSAACDSEEEAWTEAIAIASENLLKRLGEANPELKLTPIPADVFVAHARQDSFTETWSEQFGAYEQQMYRVHLKYEDSARTRGPIEDMWRQAAVEGRVLEFGAGFGVAALGLGMLSAFLRIFLAAPGRRTGPVVTTTALAAAAGALVLLA